MSRKHVPSFGFTLLEAIVVIAISTVMLIVLVDLYRAYSRMYGYQKAAADTAGSATVIANELQEWVLQSKGILASGIFSGATYTTDSDTLVLSIPSVDSLGNTLTNTYDLVIFYTSGTNVYRILSPNAASSRVANTKTLTTTLASLSFTYNNASIPLANLITTDIRMQSTEGASSAQYQLTQKLYLRNQ